jgi:hypothetical protein
MDDNLVGIAVAIFVGSFIGTALARIAIGMFDKD